MPEIDHAQLKSLVISGPIKVEPYASIAPRHETLPAVEAMPNIAPLRRASTSNLTLGRTTANPTPVVSSGASTTTSLKHLPTLEYLDYMAGSKLVCRVDPAHNRAGFAPAIDIIVLRPILPRTMSCGMLVQIKEPGMKPRQAFLKVFDRRHSTYFREYYNGGECHRWSPDLEEQYMEALQLRELPVSSKVSEDDEGMTAEKWEGLSVVEREHAFQQRMRKIHHDEREAYGRLEKHQGVDIPAMHASVYLGWEAPDTGSAAANEKYAHFLEIRGLLLEYITGFELLQVPSSLGYKTASKLFEQAVEIVRMAGAHGVCNYDVKLDNFMVTHDPSRGAHRVVMIDLGFCHMRHRAYTAEQWAKLKAMAWDGEMNQLQLEAERVTRNRFRTDLRLECKSEYGFLVQEGPGASKKQRSTPAGWTKLQTSRGVCYVNPNEVACKSSLCTPRKDVLGEVGKKLRRWTHSEPKGESATKKGKAPDRNGTAEWGVKRAATDLSGKNK